MRLLRWFANKNNLEAAAAIVALASTGLGGAWFLYDEFFRVPAQTQIITVVNGYTIEQHEERLAKRETELRAELAQAAAGDRAVLQAQLDEVRRQSLDAQASFEARKAELARAMARLDDVAEGLPQARLDAARRALADGDDSKADAIFAEVEAMEAAAISRAAEAAFERGKLAEADVRWADAAGHFARAARLDPTFDHLFSAREMTWRAGDYPSALRFGEELVTSARKEFGDESEEYSAALNEHTLTLQDTGRFAEAEPLLRQALAIDEKTIGTEHPGYATYLNNLALLLRDTGRTAEAEPLYRQALAIDEKTLGTEHPDYAIHLNNLAELLRATGRTAEAEPLYRQALAIDEKTLGTEHPDYAIHLNNLALLLQATGRHAEAEPLYRQALAIDEKTLGTEHPAYATHLNNLAELLRATGRAAEAEPLFRQALAIDEKALGTEHPDYAIDLNNLAELLRATGRAAEAEPLYRQALAILTAAFGDDHPSTRTVADNLAALEGNRGE